MAIFPSSFMVAALCSFMAHQVTTQDRWDTHYLNSTSTLSIFARKNQTGHYITRWLMNAVSPTLPNNMKIDVKSTTFEYGGIQSFRMQAEVTVPPPKPKDYELFPGIGYYKFYPDGALNYHLASTICSNDGAHLAILNSEAEADVIKLLYTRYPSAKQWAHIGFNDIQQEGKFVTIFGEPLERTGYVKWKSGEPIQHEGDEDCGAVDRNGELHDFPCEKKGPWPFFCEYDLSWNGL